MAANKKIGLLLGLAAVFVLAFVLNSAPHSGGRKANNDLAPVVVDGPSGIRPAIPPQAPPSPVPQSPSTRSAPFGPARAGVPSANEGPAPAPAVVRYVTCEGDSLAYIARNFYGPQQGNKRANVMKIFEANRRLLNSPDEIDIGQELVIPPLEAPQPQTNAEPSIFPDTMFEKVESIGRKPL